MPIPELLALTRVVAESGGGYVAHLRSESNRLLEAADELIGARGPRPGMARRPPMALLIEVD